eukprot:GHVS01025332.1.p1 GENE.GHVS01025332.1~~GHVS01025332.1.p1  ORF type:complete len:430 (+),score=71.03 GHVS01025332.1:199-1488(+)
MFVSWCKSPPSFLSTVSSFSTASGFVRVEHPFVFYPTRDLLLSAHPPTNQNKLYVAKDYFKRPSSSLPSSSFRVVKKYSTAQSHKSLLSVLLHSYGSDRPLSLYEVITAGQKRVLYFDLDGTIEEKPAHQNIVNDITAAVSRAFKLSSDPTPTVLLSDSSHKYSSHILFPQLQFSNHEEQSSCMPLLFSLLQQDYPRLAGLVDLHPYSAFQAFRAPFAVKLKPPPVASGGGGVLQIDRLCRDDPLTAFTTFANPSYSILSPGVRTADILLSNPRLLGLAKLSRRQPSPAAQRGSSPRISAAYDFNLFDDKFILNDQPKTISYSCADLVSTYEQLLPLLHPSRCSHYSTWVVLAFVTYSLLATQAIAVPALQRRVWSCWFRWSSGYKHFDQKENERVVLGCKGKKINRSLRILVQMVEHDRPNTKLIPHF